MNATSPSRYGLTHLATITRPWRPWPSTEGGIFAARQAWLCPLNPGPGATGGRVSLRT
jgi:hypothetical protein